MLFLFVEPVDGLLGIENGQNFMKPAALGPLFRQHEADNDPVAGRPLQINGLVEDRRGQQDHIIGNHIIPFSFYKMVCLRA